MEKMKTRAKSFLIVSIILMLVSMIGVSLVQTNFGHIKMKHMYWETEAGIGISANLYIPDNASVDHPAPAVVTSHGYLNNKEMQDANPAELARRGYVVIAVDQPGCGESDIADYAGENGNGMNFCAVYQAALELSRLPYVDKDKIGITGHSMGGMSCNMAALQDNASENPIISAVFLNCIDAVYTEDPAATIFGIAAIAGGDNYVNNYGTRDVGIIACQYDEFFHQTATQNGILQAPHFMEVSEAAQSFLYFGQDPSNLEKRKAGEIYHETINGEDAIRVIYNPAQIHPWSHFSKRSETATLTFFGEAFGFPKEIDASNQIWQVKEALNFLGMIGFVMFIITFATLMLYTSHFEELRADTVATAVKSGKKSMIWYVGISLISTVLACLTYHVIVEAGKGASFAEQPMIFGIALWAAFNGILSLAGTFLSYKMTPAEERIDLVDRGVKMPWKKFAKTVLLALIVVFVSYLWVFAADYFCLADFRIWNVGIKFINANTLRMALFPHAFLFMIFYIMYSVSSNSFNFNEIGGKKSFVNNLVLTLVALAPIIILLLIQYGTYFTKGFMPLNRNNEPMNVAQLWAFLLIIPGASIIDRMLYKVTKNPYLAGIITGILVAIISCANTTSVLP